jgi:uncharacterized membrane protein YeiH
LESAIYWIGMIGIVAFTISAVLAVVPKETNLWSAAVFGIITAIGGGTIRDVILDVPVFWAVDLNYIWVSLGASLGVFISQNFFTRKHIYSSILYLDGIGVALFAIEATDKVWSLAFGRPLAPIILGIVTAIGGGLIRDVLAGRQTLLMGRELYSIPVLLGCTLFVALLELLPAFRIYGAVVCCLCIFGLRAAAIHWNLTVPDWLAMKPKSG